MVVYTPEKAKYVEQIKKKKHGMAWKRHGCFQKYVFFPPKSSILIRFSIVFTIHFGVPLFLETPTYLPNFSGNFSGIQKWCGDPRFQDNLFAADPSREGPLSPLGPVGSMVGKSYPPEI